MSIYQFSAISISGQQVNLKDYQGKVLLIVNTASKCGFTPQFEGLENLYKEFQEQGLEILGFPCNQFGTQEPGTDAEIHEFCQLNYKVSFPMFEKIEVNGAGAHPLYDYLKRQAKGVLGSTSVKWNFTKFLVSQNGRVLKRYGSKDKPAAIRRDILNQLSIGITTKIP